MKITEITRSYSGTIQWQAYEPRSFFCSLKAEIQEDEVEEAGGKLQALCEKIVKKDIQRIMDAKDDIKNKKAIQAEKKDQAREEAELTVHELL